jgi:DNA-directed RNA polymerase subunit F
MNMKSKVTVVLVGLVMVMVMVMVSVLTVAAQEKPADNMQIVIEKVRADKKLLVSENMQLTEAEAKAFWPVYDQYQDELILLRKRTVKLIKDYADAYEKMSNETAKKLLDELMSIEAMGPKLRQAYLPKFRKVLPEVKVVRYYQIESKINAALMYELAANIPLVQAK